MRGLGGRSMPRDIKLMTLSLFLWGSGYGLYAYVFPLHIRSLGASPGQVGVVFSIMMVALAASYIPGGVIADRFERKRTILLSWFVGVPAPLLYYFARDYKVAAVGAVLYSLSMIGYPAMNAYAAARSPAGKTGFTFGVVNAGFAAGMIGGPVLGGWISGILGTGNVFLISFALFAVASGVIGLLSPQAPDRSGHAGGSAAGYADLLGHRQFLRFLATFSCMALAYYMIQPLIPQYLGDEVGASLALVGLAGSITSLGQAVITVWLGRLADRWGTIVALGGNALVFAASMLGLVGLHSPVLLGAALFLSGAFMAGQGVALAGVGEVLGGAATGRAFALFNVAVATSSIIGPYVGGVLYERSPAMPFLACAAALTVLSAVMFLGRRRPCVKEEVIPGGGRTGVDAVLSTDSNLGGTRGA